MTVQEGTQKGGANISSHGGPLSYLWGALHFVNRQIYSLNSSKFFAGFIIILINIGAKFITIQFSKSTEEYLKYTVSKQLLIFSMAWMGLRDIYAALGMTAILTVLSDYLFNEESSLCIIPHKYRILPKLAAANTATQGQVSDSEISSAIALLDRAKRERDQQSQQSTFMKNFTIL